MRVLRHIGTQRPFSDIILLPKSGPLLLLKNIDNAREKEKKGERIEEHSL